MSLEAGTYDFGIEHYDSDPCDAPSLTAEGVRLILDASPAHFAARHPRLSAWPELIKPREPDESLGAIVKALVLNKGHEVAPLPFEDFRTKLAQAQRDQARADGKIVCSESTFTHAETIAARALGQIGKFHAGGFRGVSDATIVWQRQSAHGPIWCRARVDHLMGRDAVMIVTMKRVTPAEVGKAIANDALDVLAAMLLWRDLRIIAIETEPPFTTYMREIEHEWLEASRAEVDAAAGNLALCLKSKTWDGPPTQPICPDFRIKQLQQRMERLP